MNLSRKTVLALAAALVLLLITALLYTNKTPNTKIAVEYTREIPEEYQFNIKSGQYIKVDEIAMQEDLKTRIMQKLSSNPATLKEEQAFGIKLKINAVEYNDTLLGVEYSNLVFLDIRPASTKLFPLVFTYTSPEGDKRTIKKYLLKDAREIEVVGILNEVTVTKNSPRSIVDSIRFSLFNNTGQGSEEPIATLNHRIMVCSKWGC